MAEQSIAELLKRKQEILTRLEGLGISSKDMTLTHNLLIQYQELLSVQEVARNSQFYGDAIHLTIDLRITTTRNKREIARFLRQFAEHVATYVLKNLNSDFVDDIPDVVDNIPQLEPYSNAGYPLEEES